MGDFAVPDQLRFVEQVGIDYATSSLSTVTTYAWVELIAATAETTILLHIHLGGPDATATTHAPCLDIAVGPEGSEQVIVERLYNTVRSGSADGFKNVDYWIPITIPAGVRVSARCYRLSDLSTDTTIYFSLGLYNGIMASAPSMGLEYVGSAALLDDEPAQNVNSAYVVINASSPRRYRGFYLGFHNPDNISFDGNWLATLSIGADGSEEPIFVMPLGGASNSYAINPQLCMFQEIEIAQGARIAARASTSRSGTSNRITAVLWGLV